MTVLELREKLTEAGNKFDGHVTIGSMEEQLKVIDQYIKELPFFPKGVAE